MGVQGTCPTLSESTSSEMMNRGAANAKCGKPTLRVAEGDTIMISCVEPSSSIVAGYQVRVFEREAREFQSRLSINIHFVVTEYGYSL